jgi:hypothetical protein
MRMDKCPRFCKIALLQTLQEKRMSHHGSHHESHHADSLHEPDPADSRADAIAAFFAIAIAVSGVLFFISQQ